MPFSRQRFEVRVKVGGQDQLLCAFAGEVRATKWEAEQYLRRAITAWEAGDTSEWYVLAWEEICLIGPDGLFERYVRPVA